MRKEIDIDWDIIEAIYQEYYAFLKGFVYIIVKNNEDAEDVVQDFFSKLGKRLQKYDSSKPLIPWLMEIAKNDANSFLRKRDRHISFDEQLHTKEDRHSSYDILELKGILTDDECEFVYLYYCLKYSKHRTYQIMNVTYYRGRDISKRANKKIECFRKVSKLKK